MHDDDAILVHNNKIVGGNNNNNDNNRRESPAREPARICGEPVRTTEPAPTRKKLPGFFAKGQQLGFFRAPSWASVSYTYVLWRDLRACQILFLPTLFYFILFYF